MVKLNEENALKQRLDELSRDTLKSYIKTALNGKRSSLANHAFNVGNIRAQQDEINRITDRPGNSYQKRNELRKIFDVDDEKAGKSIDLSNRRIKGINLAAKKLAKEDIEGLEFKDLISLKEAYHSIFK